MKLKNQKGSGLVGILVVIVIIAALMYGSSFFWPKNENTDGVNVKSPIDAIKALDQAKDDIADIQKNLDKQAEVLKDETPGDESEQEKDDVYETGNDIIKIFNIKAGDNIISPVNIKGEGAAFENILIVELRNSDHIALVQEHATLKSPDIGVNGPFSITINFDFSSTKEGYIAVYEQSAKDGTEINLVEIPVKFNDTSDWQTYYNNRFGYSVNVPKDWVIVEDNNDVGNGLEFKTIIQSPDYLIDRPELTVYLKSGAEIDIHIHRLSNIKEWFKRQAGLWLQVHDPS